MRRGWVAPALIALVASCTSSSSGQPARVGQMTQAAVQFARPEAAPTDVAFDAFLKTSNLRQALGPRADEVLGQLQAGRAAVAAKRSAPPASSRAGGTVLVGAVTSVLMPLIFAETLAALLEPLTAGRGGGALPSTPYSDTEEGPTSRTTTTLNESDTVSATGSRVQLAMTWTLRTTTVDKASGNTLSDLTDDRTMVGTLDVCPNPGGGIPGTLDTHLQIAGGAAGGGTSTRSATSSDTFNGQDDDAAVLRRVTQEFHDQSSWSGGSGSGSFDAHLTNVGWSAGGSGLGSFDAGAVGGSVSSTGSSPAADVNQAAGWAVVLDARALEKAYYEAQRLWRNGRCVVITAPDYSAETPLGTTKQNETQHDEEVATGSVTKFVMGMRHRFAGSLNQPSQASLTSGDKKLDPTHLGSAPASLSYTAPDEQDKKAVAQLKSTSKRGIGTLALAFHTAGRRLALTMKTTITVQTPGTPIGVVVDDSFGPVNFTPSPGGGYEATAQFQGTGRLTGFELPGCPTVVTENGTVKFTATVEKRADTSVWIVRADPTSSTDNLNASNCGLAYANALTPTAGYAVIAVTILGDIVLPIDGGTASVHGSKTTGGVTDTVDGTATGTVTKS